MSCKWAMVRRKGLMGGSDIGRATSLPVSTVPAPVA